MDKTAHKEQSRSVELSPEQVKSLRSDRFSVVRSIGYVGAGIAGLGMGVSKVWDLFYDRFKNYPQLAKYREVREQALTRIGEQARKHDWSYAESAAKVRHIENAWSSKFNRLAKDIFKVESEGPLGVVKGTFQRLGHLGGYTVAKVVFAAVLSTAIVAGGVMILEQNMRRRKAMDELARQLDAKEAERSRA